MKYIITAKSSKGERAVAVYDEVFDSFMMTNPSDSERFVLFGSKKDAKDHIPAYQSFQRTLTDFKVEKV